MGGAKGTFGGTHGQLVQVRQAMEINELRAGLDQAAEIIETLQRREKLLTSMLMRFRVVVIDMAGDRDPAEMRPIHTVTREHLAEIDKQAIRCAVLPSADFTALECFVWTTPEGDAAIEALTKLRAQRKVPDEPMELVKHVDADIGAPH